MHQYQQAFTAHIQKHFQASKGKAIMRNMALNC